MRLATVGLLLVLAVGLMAAGGMVAADSSIDTVDRQDILDLDTDESPDRHGQSASADLGLGADATDATLRAELEQRTVAAELRKAPPDERAAIVESYLERLDDEVEALVQADIDSLEAATQGELTVRELLIEATETGYTASARQQTLNDLAALDDAVPDLDVTAAVTRLELRYDIIAGPTRDRVLAAATDPDRPTTIGLEVTTAGLALISVDEHRYHREAVRYDRFAMPGDAVETLSAAESIAAEAYPSSTATVALRDLGAGLYHVERSLPAGSVTAFVGGGSEAVVVERQYRWLDQVEVDLANSVDEDGVELTIERSFTGGPLRVTITDADTGAAIEGTAYLRHGGTWTPLGAVDEGGQVWGPDPGGPIDIRVVTPDGIISVSAER